MTSRLSQTQRITMKKIAVLSALALAASLCGSAHAGIVFKFLEDGGDVVMTSSGTIDTSKLVLMESVYGWGGVGIEENGNHDIIGGTTVGAVNMSFRFHDGTNFTAWSSLTGPWATSNFSATVDAGQKGFTTYVRDDANRQVPGLGIERQDLVGSLWSPDQEWTFSGASFASLQMFAGTYTVTDAQTGEFITFQIGEPGNQLPEPGVLGLAGLALLGAGAARRRKA